MPAIASKYRRGDAAPDLEKHTERDDAGLVRQDVQGALYYGGNEVYLYPKVKGMVAMKNYSKRKPLISAKPEFQHQNSFHGSEPKNLTNSSKSKPVHSTNFGRTKGREDNLLYRLNDGYNLDKQKRSNQFS